MEAVPVKSRLWCSLFCLSHDFPPVPFNETPNNGRTIIMHTKHSVWLKADVSKIASLSNLTPNNKNCVIHPKHFPPEVSCGCPIWDKHKTISIISYVACSLYVYKQWCQKGDAGVPEVSTTFHVPSCRDTKIRCLSFRPTCVLSLLIGWYGNSFALYFVPRILFY